MEGSALWHGGIQTPHSFSFSLFTMPPPASGESPEQGKLRGMGGLPSCLTFALSSHAAEAACSELIGAQKETASCFLTV